MELHEIDEIISSSDSDDSDMELMQLKIISHRSDSSLFRSNTRASFVRPILGDFCS